MQTGQNKHNDGKEYSGPTDRFRHVRPKGGYCSDLEEGDIVSYLQPISVVDSADHTSIIGWLYEVGEISAVAPWTVNARSGGEYQTENVVKIHVEHHGRWGGTIDEVHPKMINGVYPDCDDQIIKRVELTQQGLPTSLASEHLAVSYNQNDLEGYRDEDLGLGGDE